MLGNVMAQGLSPRWVLVPDVVADREATLAKWEQYAPVAVRYGWPLAIAVQDGMTPADIPAGAEVISLEARRNGNGARYPCGRGQVPACMWEE